MTGADDTVADDHSTARAGTRQWLGLALLALPTLVIGMDLTVLHLAVPHVSADLQPSSTQLLWITDVYGFMIAGLLITMGTVGDRIGRRRLLVIGATAFALASVLAAYSTSPEMLIATRALLGVTGATLMPSTLSLISTMFRDPQQRGFAIAVWMINFMVGGAVGPLVGGALLDRFWWGSVFIAAVPVMALLVVLARTLLPEYRASGSGRIDPASVVLSLVAILAVVYGVKELARYGLDAGPAGALAGGLAVGTIFVRRQSRLPEPLLDLQLLRTRTVSTALGAQLVSLFAIAGVQFLILQHLQLVEGMSALRAGALVVPAMGAAVVSSLLAPAAARRFQHAPVIVAAMLVGAAGMIPIALSEPGGGAASVVVGFTLVSVGLNAAVALTYDLSVGAAPHERAGAASGMAETASELGLALGVATAGSIATAVYRGRLGEHPLPEQVPGEAADAVRDTLGAAVDVATGLDSGPAAAVLDLTRDAFTQGMQAAAVTMAVLVTATATLTAVLLRRDAPAAAGAEDGTPGSDAGADPSELTM